MNKEKTKFLVEFGAEYIGKSELDVDYVKPLDKLSEGIVNTQFLFYNSANIIKTEGCEVLAEIYNPYFSRTYGAYCSHQNTPNKLEPEKYTAAVKNGRVVYLAHNICEMYNEFGAQYHRDYFINALKLIYTKPVANVEMLSAGRMRFVKQEDENRYILHLLYGQPIKRGAASVIEDLPTIYNIPATIRVDEDIKSIKLMPQNENIVFEKNGQIVDFTVPYIQSHQVIVLEY